MRLINCATFRLESDGDWTGPTPRYAILSHTWAENGDEVTFQEYQQEYQKYQAWAVQFGHVTFQQYREYQAGQQHHSHQPKKWEKIDRTVQLALQQNIRHVWIDSCCIDKTNNAELSESINSMFKWYAQAVVCYANIEHFTTAGHGALGDASIDPSLVAQLSGCRWFRRGWTLQELIAPSYVEFYDMNWSFFGTRHGLSATLAHITKIDKEVLASPADGRSRNLNHVLSLVPVARKMSWASSRETKKVEDEAYCLLGIFTVNMPMMYGEGDQAFVRLQEEILRNSNDMTIFAWAETHNVGVSEYRGVLAQSPKEFGQAGALSHSLAQHLSPVYTMTNKGLQIRTRLQHVLGTHLMFMTLNCHETDHAGSQWTRGILLRFQGAGTYVRAQPDRLEYGKGPAMRPMPEKEIYITKHVFGPSIATNQQTSQQGGYHLNVQEHHPSIMGGQTGSNEYLLRTLAPSTRPSSSLPLPLPPPAQAYYPNAEPAASTNIPLLTKDSIRIELIQRKGKNSQQQQHYVDRTAVSDSSHFHEPLDSFITTGIPNFTGVVRFRTRGALSEPVADFLLVCGLVLDEKHQQQPWACLAFDQDPISQAHQTGLTEHARELALKRQTTRLNFSEEMKMKSGNVRNQLSTSSARNWGAKGLSVSVTIMRGEEDEEEGGGGNGAFIMRIEAQPWKTYRHFVMLAITLLAFLAIGLGAGISITKQQRESEQAFDSF